MLWETSNNNKAGHIYITHRLFAYERKFAWAGSNWNAQKGRFLHENVLMLELRGLLGCFHWTHFSQNEAHVTSPPEVLVSYGTWVHSAISTSVQDSARKKIHCWNLLTLAPGNIAELLKYQRMNNFLKCHVFLDKLNIFIIFY